MGENDSQWADYSVQEVAAVNDSSHHRKSMKGKYNRDQ